MPQAGPLRFDVSFHGGPERMDDFARRAEERGAVAGVFTPEGAHDPFIGLALAAAATSRVQVGSGIAVAFARTPMAMAYAAHDLQRVAGGRFVLGLGSQIKAHITRRFAMPWSSPAARMEEYVEALRAIWDAWQTGEKLDFRGEFYAHTLMPPLFSPGPLESGPPPVWLAGVGPRMVEAAGRVADGILSHPLISRAYLADDLLPAVSRGRAAGSRADQPFELAAMAMVATGRDEEGLAAAISGTRRQIGFYASTPAYKPVLDHHGWGDLHQEAHTLSVTNRWDELPALVDDSVLDMFAVVGELDQVGRGLRERFGDLVDRVTLSMPYQADEELALDIVSAAS